MGSGENTSDEFIRSIDWVAQKDLEQDDKAIATITR
jgi:hypothetical protein